MKKNKKAARKNKKNKSAGTNKIVLIQNPRPQNINLIPLPPEWENGEQTSIAF